MNTTYYLACDLRAEGGRVMLGSLKQGQLTVQEIHSFAHKTQLMEGRTCWDLASLEKEIFAGIKKAAELNRPISGLSADSWGVDYVLLDGDSHPLSSPCCGEGRRGQSVMDNLLKKLSLTTIYAETGIPLLPLHTLFLIEAHHTANPALFQRAQRFLPIADYLNTRFSGEAACEESLASTTQLYNPQTHAWSPKLVEALGLPGRILPRLVPSGTAFGLVIDELRAHAALLNTRVIATCSHDAAAAIAAIPARAEQRWAFFHSDSASQFGVELDAPMLSSQARDEGFTNEVGLGGSIRFLKYGFGLGLILECRRAWEAAGQIFADEELTRMAQRSGPAQAHLALADPRFHVSGDLPKTIAAYCGETCQPVPIEPGDVVRVILESLALGHAETLHQIEALTQQEIEVVHVVGQGSTHDLLNLLTADATGLPVMAGPVDGAAIGNILIQALALWHIKSPDHLRSIVASSFPTRLFKPGYGFARPIRERFHALSQRAQLATA